MGIYYYNMFRVFVPSEARTKNRPQERPKRRPQERPKRRPQERPKRRPQERPKHLLYLKQLMTVITN